MKKIKDISRKLGIVVLWGIFLTLLITAFFLVGGRFRALKKSNIKVRFLQTVNDADCIVISQGERGIMIDTGEEIDAEGILRELHDAGITTLDYLILSHPDSDHIGGALEIVKNISVLKVIEPYFDGEKKELEDFHDYCNENKIPIFYPTHTWRIRTEYIHLLVYPPLENHYKDTNNYSLAVLAEHGSIRMLFTGDGKRKRLEELLSMNLPKIDLYKVPHHGRGNQATSKIFDKIRPNYAVVTSDTADKEVLDSCIAWDTMLLFTNEKTLTFESTGEFLNLEE